MLRNSTMVLAAGKQHKRQVQENIISKGHTDNRLTDFSAQKTFIEVFCQKRNGGYPTILCSLL